MNTRKLTLEQRFPTQRAREIADRTTDEISADAPMTTFIDRWLEAYFAAGGLFLAPDGRKRNSFIE